MFGLIQITVWHWLGFIALVLVLLALDLGLFHRRAHVVKYREALMWTGIWVCLALAFALALRPLRGEKETLEFLTGYLIELSLSMDNVFVIALIFAYFRVPANQQHRVLFWGILGALVMRGSMILVGAALISVIHWVLYLLGLLILYSGIKMLFARTEVAPEKNRVIRWVRKFYPVAPHLDGQKLVTQWNGKRALTPLALVLVMIETSDLVFALDSIPAIFAVTTKPFIVFTSNVFAILGLRSLYFVLAGAIGYFRYLKYGLSLVLVFIGVKMLLDPHEGVPPLPFQVEIPISTSLLVVGGILLVSMVASAVAAQREEKKGARSVPVLSPKAEGRNPKEGRIPKSE
jgi:tellurite resistance protein TerC